MTPPPLELPSRIVDLEGLEVQQILGESAGAVVMRVQGPEVLLMGQFSPDEARRIATDLMTAAARAEYEHDFYLSAKGAGFSDEAMGDVLGLIRDGEAQRAAGDG